MIELHFPDALTSEDGFFDRRAEWPRIENTVRDRGSTPVILLGERRIGKTSMLNLAVQRLERDVSLRCVPLYLPFGPLMRSLEDLARELIVALCVALRRPVRETNLYDSDGRFHLPSIGEFWQEIAHLVGGAGSQTFLVCIDEFDGLLHACQLPAQLAILDLMQDLIDRRSALAVQLRLLLTMTNLHVAEMDLRNSLLVSKARTIVLNSFSYDEMTEMVRKLLHPPAVIYDTAMKRLFELSAGHPFITKLLLDRLLSPWDFEEEGLVVTEAALADAAAEAAEDQWVSAVLGNLYEQHFDDQQKSLMLWLAECQGTRQTGVTARQLSAIGVDYITAAEKLVRRGYLEIISTENDTEGVLYRLRIAFLGQWLRRWELYQLELERRLKAVRGQAVDHRSTG